MPDTQGLPAGPPSYQSLAWNSDAYLIGPAGPECPAGPQAPRPPGPQAQEVQKVKQAQQLRRPVGVPGSRRPQRLGTRRHDHGSAVPPSRSSGTPATARPGEPAPRKSGPSGPADGKVRPSRRCGPPGCPGGRARRGPRVAPCGLGEAGRPGLCVSVALVRAAQWAGRAAVYSEEAAGASTAGPRAPRASPTRFVWAAISRRGSSGRYRRRIRPQRPARPCMCTARRKFRPPRGL